MKTTITNFDELINFISNNDLSKKQIDILVINTLNVWISPEIQKDEIVQKLKELFKKYPEVAERPLFLDN
jgi:hypothetical protein